MAVIEGGASGAIAGVGAETGSPLHISAKADAFGVLGHYRTSHRAVLVNVQAANSRLFEFQNSGANLMVIKAIRIFLLQTGVHTAAIEDSIDIFKCTGFSVIDPNNTVTPAVSKMRASMGNNANAVVRGVTVAGASAGMTGGTLVKDAQPLKQYPIWLLAAVPTTVPTNFVEGIWIPDTGSGEHPLVLANNEGFEIENRVLLGAAAADSFYCDVAWAEVTAY